MDITLINIEYWKNKVAQRIAQFDSDIEQYIEDGEKRFQRDMENYNQLIKEYNVEYEEYVKTLNIWIERETRPWWKFLQKEPQYAQAFAPYKPDKPDKCYYNNPERFYNIRYKLIDIRKILNEAENIERIVLTDDEINLILGE